jgi:Tol biopolymer transport system component
MICGRRSAVVVLAVLALFGAGCDYIARPSQGTAPNDPATTFGSFSPVLSGDGRFVAFSSQANDLVPGDDNDSFDVFVRDLQNGTTTRVSVDTSGGDANASSSSPSISADGHLVAFVSGATDLVVGDGSGGINQNDVFVRNLLTGVTTRVSVDMAGGDADATSDEISISANGRFVAFSSDAADLVPGDSHRVDDQGSQFDSDVFVRDLQTGTTTRPASTLQAPLRTSAASALTSRATAVSSSSPPMRATWCRMTGCPLGPHPGPPTKAATCSFAISTPA